MTLGQLAFVLSHSHLNLLRMCLFCGLEHGLLTEGPLLGHLSIRDPLLLYPTLSPQLEVRQVQADVENQMLMITSDSQKHRGQVAFLSVRLAHPARGPGFPSALRQAEGVLGA